MNFFFCVEHIFKCLRQIGRDLRFLNFCYVRPLRLLAQGAEELHMPVVMVTQTVSRTSWLLL